MTFAVPSARFGARPAPSVTFPAQETVKVTLGVGRGLITGPRATRATDQRGIRHIGARRSTLPPLTAKARRAPARAGGPSGHSGRELASGAAPTRPARRDSVDRSQVRPPVGLEIVELLEDDLGELLLGDRVGVEGEGLELGVKADRDLAVLAGLVRELLRAGADGLEDEDR